jgi:hypothetical protein
VLQSIIKGKINIPIKDVYPEEVLPRLQMMIQKKEEVL